MPTSNRAIKYRIYPTSQQESLIRQTFGCVRKVYNKALQMQTALYKAGVKHLSAFQTNTICTREWKEEYPYLRDVDKFALTQSLLSLERGFQSFFAKRTGYPKFKSKRQGKQSYTTSITGNNIQVGEDFVKLPKLGRVPAVIHRQPGSNWEIKQATVSKTASGRYYVSVLFEFEANIPDRTIDTVNALGLDYDNPLLYVDSNGQSPDHPRAFFCSKERLAREQRRLSRMTPGSRNYEKQRLRVAKVHEYIANQRKDFLHKLSRKIANSCDIVSVEDVDLRVLASSESVLTLGVWTHDNGFGMLRTLLEYKLEEQGKVFVKVPREYPSTRICNACGDLREEVGLAEKKWVCNTCGALILRDHNAAKNIRDEGVRIYLESLLSAAEQ